MDNYKRLNIWDGYRSPLRAEADLIQTQIVREAENQIMSKVKCRLDVDIDAEELKKALVYDRNQYGQGYAAGYAQAQRDLESHSHWEWVPTETRLWRLRCAKCKEGKYCSTKQKRCPWCGAIMDEEIAMIADGDHGKV